MDDRNPDLPDWFHQVHSALDDKMGLEMLELSADRASGRMPVQGNTQPYRMWHGGASCVLAETLASLAAAAAVLPDRMAVGVDINATHHRPVTDGYVTGTATALRIGRNVLTYDVVLVDDNGDRVCSARVTCQAISPRTP